MLSIVGNKLTSHTRGLGFESRLSMMRIFSSAPRGTLRVVHVADPNRTRIQNRPDPDQTRPGPFVDQWVPHADVIWRLTNGRLPRSGGAVITND